MEKNYFYSKIDTTEKNKKLLQELKKFADKNQSQVYVIREPLGEEKYNYDYTDVMNILIPGYKILIVNIGSYENEEFDCFCDDFIEDLSHISDKFTYKSKIGRPRVWKKNQIEFIDLENFDVMNFMDTIQKYKLQDSTQKRVSELLISLLIGSINSIEGIEVDEPENLLEKVKQKIVLFDSDQTRFIFENVKKDRVTIQGLAGTGKTELLLHKLKELYTKENKSKIVFTCFSKTLSSNLKHRVPEFFTAMKVEEQIQWDERLWVHGSWGSEYDPDSGLYSLICNIYKLPFHRYSRRIPFASFCREAIDILKKREDFEPYFDYILIDESQDFCEEFFELCELVTKEAVYIAGDIFQNIFDTNNNLTVKPDFLLNKCYRTDPRTLMFSHSIGLALFERPVVNWLSDSEWGSCGYEVEKRENNQYRLTRDTIRRFEDIDNMPNIHPVEIYNTQEAEILDKVIGIINGIKKEHPTVIPDDIGIVFVDDNTRIYKMIDILEWKIYDEMNWNVNKGYDNKGQIENTLFISNRNNIKGLEFPFLICVVTGEIEKSIKARNTLYMTLTRSFISSHLVMVDNLELYNIWNRSLTNIIENNELLLEKPDETDIMSKEQLEINRASYRTYEEVLEMLFEEFKIEKDVDKTKMTQIIDVYTADKDGMLEDATIRQIIKNNLGILNEKNNRN